MNALETKLATAIAQDTSIDLSTENMDVLFGFGCADFKPVHVSLRTVAKCMRWQCLQFDGGWDWKQYNEDLPHYRRNVLLTDLNAPELRAWLVTFVQSRFHQLQAAA